MHIGTVCGKIKNTFLEYYFGLSKTHLLRPLRAIDGACAKQFSFGSRKVAHAQKRHRTDLVHVGYKSCRDRGGTDTGRATGAFLMDREALFV